MPLAENKTLDAAAGYCRCANAIVLVLLSVWFLLLPGIIVIRQLCDPNNRSAGIPGSAWELHKALSPRYGNWARQRLASQRAASLTTGDISGTEWPLFGSVFYLWATESLQEAWERNPAWSTVAPKVYARDAIEAAANLVIDPTQANWVKIHWGEHYLKTQNVFYRMLVISALTSHAILTGEKEHLALLKDQADSLSAELEASRYGLLDDYPGQCYPGDVLTAVAMIRKADKVLGTDHSAFVNRAIRGFQNAALDARGLVPYSANASLGTPVGMTRGCDNSYVSLFAPDIWPEQARIWYDLYTKYFWQERHTCAGFREFPNDMAGSDWYLDVDSGPVWGGFGCAACAFGVGAARANGHFEQAWPLTAEMLVTSWPLPDGTRLFPRLFSNAVDAPYIGEAAILFNLTRLPGEGVSIKTGGALPKFVVIFLSLQLALGILLSAGAVLSLWQWQKRLHACRVPRPGLQVGIWSGLVLAGIIGAFCGQPVVVVLLLMCAQFLPRCKPVSTAQISRP